MAIKNDPLNTIVFFENDDFESKLMRYIFNNLKFEYPPMGGSVTSYEYIKAKDYIKWQGLHPKNVIPLIDEMFNKFKQRLPKS